MYVAAGLPAAATDIIQYVIGIIWKMVQARV
jgi:hypothetical protein